MAIETIKNNVANAFKNVFKTNSAPFQIDTNAPVMPVAMIASHNIVIPSGLRPNVAYSETDAATIVTVKPQTRIYITRIDLSITGNAAAGGTAYIEVAYNAVKPNVDYSLAYAYVWELGSVTVSYPFIPPYVLENKIDQDILIKLAAGGQDRHAQITYYLEPMD